MKTIGWTTQAVCLLGFIVLSGCGSTTPPSTATIRVGTSHDQAAIHMLHRRIHERERTIAIQNYQIEVMTGQLDALKRIDQDTREQRRPLRNLINIAP
jgi:hypothetical protein